MDAASQLKKEGLLPPFFMNIQGEGLTASPFLHANKGLNNLQVFKVRFPKYSKYFPSGRVL